MKNLIITPITICIILLFFISCNNDNGDGNGTTPTPTPTGKTKDITASITSETTWVEDTIYVLKGSIFVESGAELTIAPGTIIKGDKATKGSLIICRGAKIHAKGTAAKPIVFTSSAPKGFRSSGDWGGVVILGKANNNQSANQLIEGISDSGTSDNGKYGGTTNDDSSGEFYYVRIEFPGIALSVDNEINGLTMGSVGSGTEIHHVQVSYSGDDSFEWFGGTVNTKYLVAYRGWDDDFDVDFGYSGKNQFLASFRDPNLADKSGSCSFESDNDGSGSTNTPKTTALFSNVTSFGPYVYARLSSGNLTSSNASQNYTRGAHIRRNTDIQIINSVLVGWGQSQAVYFDETGHHARFVKNYIARTIGDVKTSKAKNGYDDSHFNNDNVIETDQATVDLSSVFTGMSAAMNIDAPSALLASGSKLLSGATTIPNRSGLQQTQYIGAFDTSTNWMSGWTNFDPNNTNYEKE